jgi:4a-hydroxytetrahydrobiopterin dehydratase
MQYIANSSVDEIVTSPHQYHCHVPSRVPYLTLLPHHPHSRPPERIGEFMGLKNKRCVPCEGGDIKPLEDAQVNRLRLQCPGWKVITNAEGAPALSYEWQVRGFKAGLDLLHRLGDIAEAEGHHPDLHLTGYNKVTAELTTHAAGGLTENDFIMAAKINEVELADLLTKRKPKFWA